MTTHVLQVLRLAQPIAQRNAHVLDHISTPPAAPPRTTPPISKYILSTLFNSPHSPHTRHVFIENDQENHFLYGLVLPLIARLLAVSTPGLVCVVQLPRTDNLPEWALPPPFDSASNGSNGSKSAAPTTLSPQGTSRTPSPSDERATPRKSLSPDAHPGTAELIRHADKLLSGAEAAADAVRDQGSPPPNPVMEDHRALRLICNGFEVLTGKMPPPRVDMGSFTLASVGWEKAGIISPENNTKGVSMSFSNGMMTPTEGIVVTFSNGSLVLLTLRDPLSMIHTLKITDATPIVVFSFCNAGQMTVADLLAQKKESLGEEAARVQTSIDRENVFVVEIGQSGSDAPNSNNTNAQAGTNYPEPSPDPSQTAPPEKQPTRVPPVLITAIPRAVPLFVNTINQTFIDAPYCSQDKEDEIDDKFDTQKNIDVKTNNESVREQNTDGADNVQQEQNSATRCPNNVQRTASSTEQKIDPPAETMPPPNQQNQSNREEVVQTSAPTSVANNIHVTSSMINMDASSRNPESALPPPRHPSMYNYYGYGHSSVYRPDNSRPHQVMSHRQLVPTAVPVHQNQPSMSGPHGYYHQPSTVQAGPHQPNGHNGYHPHHPGPPYAPGGYYAMPPPSMIHQPPLGNSQWHRMAMPHAPAPLRPPHPMDARRDMPIHFSSHHAVASSIDAQYPSHYYPPPSNNAHMYPAQPSGVVSDGAMRSDVNRLNSLPGESAGPAEGPIHGADPRIGHPGYAVQALEESKGKEADGQFVVPDPKDSSKRQCIAIGTEVNEQKDAELTKSRSVDNRTALEALVRIGEGDGRQSAKRQSHSMLGSEQQTSAGVEEKTSGAGNRSESIVGRVNGVQVNSKSRTTPNRNRTSAKTNSSTSTNSQGGALVKGAITGNSHGQPHQKRARQQ